MSTYDEALVEKAARALSTNWRNMYANEALGYQRMLARAMLDAVADDLQAEGWVRGFDAARDTHPSWWNKVRRTENPYRADEKVQDKPEAGDS